MIGVCCSLCCMVYVVQAMGDDCHRNVKCLVRCLDSAPLRSTLIASSSCPAIARAFPMKAWKLTLLLASIDRCRRSTSAAWTSAQRMTPVGFLRAVWVEETERVCFNSRKVQRQEMQRTQQADCGPWQLDDRDKSLQLYLD